jgi:hypothetical protein
MSLKDLMQTALPMNRKERFFTGTVFPMIVCGNGFKDFGQLAALIPGCELPHVDPDPKTTNIQFFSEYSLVEAISGSSRARFPNPPDTKDTPDIIILIKGTNRTVLVALEAKVFHRPDARAVMTQMAAQRKHLNYLREQLGLDAVYHAALLPRGLAREIGPQLARSGPDSFPVILWEDLLERYRAARGGDDYWMSMLDLAMKAWPELSSTSSFGSYGQNAELNLTGQEILSRYGKDPRLSIMGRSRGLYGPKLTEDIQTGQWRRQSYEVSSLPEPPNGNWFMISDFVAMVAAGPAKVDNSFRPAKREVVVQKLPPSGRRFSLTGEDIMVRVGDGSVRIVGRSGGLYGKVFEADVANGRWQSQIYEVSDAAEPMNRNWFTVEDFVRRTQGR